jgi:hypothetical protein
VFIAMQAQGLGDIRGPEVLPDLADKAAISLSVDDLYSADEHITIRAQLNDTQQDFGGIQAEIRSLTGESSLQPLQLNQTGDRWSVETGDLAPGVYQVTVQTVQTPTASPAAVRDVFEVI